MAVLLQRFARWLVRFPANENRIAEEDHSPKQRGQAEKNLRPSPANTYAKAINGEPLSDADIDAVIFEGLEEL